MNWKDQVFIGLVVLGMALFIIFWGGCATAKDNTAKGLEVRDVGFQPHDMGSVKSGRDTQTQVSLVGGVTGIVSIVGLQLLLGSAIYWLGKDGE
jgi:hypothetical protein